MSECNGLTTATELIKDGGIITVLLAGIWAFIKGQIVPKGYVEELKEHAETQTILLAKELTKGMKEVAKEGAKEGAIAAIEHINNKA